MGAPTVVALNEVRSDHETPRQVTNLSRTRPVTYKFPRTESLPMPRFSSFPCDEQSPSHTDSLTQQLCSFSTPQA